MKLNGFIGQAYNLKDVNIECQRCVNLYPEVDESGNGKDQQVMFLKSTPALRPIFDVGSGPIRLIHFDGLEKDDGSYFQVNRLFVVSGAEVYRLTYDAFGSWDSLLLGSLGTTNGPVSAASLSQDYGVTVFVDGSNENYVYRKTTTTTETFQTFTAAGFVPVQRATQVVWLDGYFIFIVEGSNQFYVSDWNSLNVSALSFASAEGDPDNILAIVANHRDLWLMNERTVEIFSNTGNADFPFERVQGGFIENGILAAFSLAKIGGTIFWLGRNNSGQGIIYAAEGAQHQRISTYAIESAIQSYANPSNARGYCYQDNGHIFYVLNFDETSWCYDVTTKMWHERCYTSDDGALERHRGQCHAFYPNFGKHIIGDYQNAKLYQFDDNYYTDALQSITRLRTTPHISASMKRVFYSQLQIDMKVGVGLDGSTDLVGHDPQIMMQYSDDGGNNWSNEKWASFGKLGEFKKRVIWRRLGQARDRVFRVKITDPVRVVFLNAEIELAVGVS